MTLLDGEDTVDELSREATLGAFESVLSDGLAVLLGGGMVKLG